MIFISAGHHENAQGAKFNDVTEFSLTTVWADRIAELLGKKCIRVPNGTLKEKVDFINSVSDVSLAVEIHFNSFKLWKDQNANGIIDDGEMINAGRGSETLYYPSSKTGVRAAKIVQQELGRVMQPDRGAKEGWYQMNKSKGADFFLAKCRCTALIIEPEFIDNLGTIHGKIDLACYTIASALLEITSQKE